MIHQVGDKNNIYCLDQVGVARVFFVSAPEFTLIDAATPGNVDKILIALSQIGIRPLQVKRIILTHHHWDHVGSLWDLKKRTGAQVIAHPRDADYITGKRSRRAPRGVIGNLMYRIFGLMGAAALPKVDVDQPVEEAAQVGGFTVVHTPGHTPGHICLQYGDYLFSGDLLQASPGKFNETPHVFTADVPASRASIRKVARLDFRAILSSHRPPYLYGAADKVRELASELGMAG